MKSEKASIQHILSRLVSSSGCYGSSQIVQHVLGFILTILAARMLDPREVGLIAIAWLVINALDVFSRSGAADAIIHIPENIHTYLSTYLWIELLRGAILAVIGIASSFLVSSAFNEPEASPIISNLALLPLLRGLRSPGVVMLQREMRYKQWGVFETTRSIMSFAISSISLAVWSDPKIFVYSILAGELLSTLVSYVVAPFCPQFEFRRQSACAMLNYGKWLLGAGIVSYLAMHLDRIVIGKLGSATMLGIYSVSLQVSEALTYRFSKIISVALQPAYAKLQDKKSSFQLLQIHFKLSYILFTVIVSILWAWSPRIFPRLLGEEWASSGPVFSVLIITGLIKALSAVASPYFKGIGKPKNIFIIETIRAILLALIIVPSFYMGGLTGASIAITLAALIQLIITLLTLLKDHCINCRFFLSLIPATVFAIALGVTNRFAQERAADNLTYMLASIFLISMLGTVSLIALERKWVLMLLKLIKPNETYNRNNEADEA